MIPGDQQVTILWRPSLSEAQGDAYFAIANDPTQGARYDPAYRQFDVEGYRIYRGRTDTPNQLELVAQFDYTGTQIFDFRGPSTPTKPADRSWVSMRAAPGRSRPRRPCHRPAHGLCRRRAQRPHRSGPSRPARRPHQRHGSNRQWAECRGPPGDRRQRRIPGAGQHRRAVHLYRQRSGLLSAPRNNVRYFYSVTAFDVNSFVSGPASLESQRAAKAIIPVKPASNARGLLARSPRAFSAGMWSSPTARCRRSTPRPASSADRSRRRTPRRSGSWATSRPTSSRRAARSRPR